MGTAPYKAIFPAMMQGNAPPLELVFPEATGQTFKRGEPVYLVDGKVTKLASATGSLILGFAAQDAFGTANYMVPVWIAGPNTYFVANLTNNGSDGTLAVSVVGNQYGLYDDQTTNGCWRVDLAVKNVANSRVTVVDIYGVDARDDMTTAGATAAPTMGAPLNVGRNIVNATNGRVLFLVPELFRQFGRTS